MNAPPPVELSHVVKRYGAVLAVNDIDLVAAPGEILALAGHNGAGKTTLFKLILGLAFPNSGTVRVFGRSPTGAGAVAGRRRIGFLPENVVFSGNMTGRELLGFYARLKRVAPAQCDDLLTQVGLADAAAKRVRTYSKGMRQRLGLAQMLLGEPALLLLDEPTTGLDPTSRQRFYALVDERRSRGATVVLCSHALADIEGWADRIALLQRGRLITSGTLEELRQRTALPARIRFRAPPDSRPVLRAAAGALAEFREINGRMVELACPPESRAEVLRRIDITGQVRDLEILMPRLEDIYRHYQGDEVAK